MIPYKKSEVVKAMQAILAEYEQNVHQCNMDCPLCQLYYHKYPNCHRCPMNVFYSYDDTMGCIFRRCEPMSPEDTKGIKGKNKLEAVKEFYKKAITKVRAKTVAQLNEVDAFNFLIDIDNKVAEKYKLPVRKQTNETMGE